MEQKKILWIFFIVIAFLVLVFGVAWYFYAPGQKHNYTEITNLEEEYAYQPSLASIDADAWSKKETAVPTPQGGVPTTVNIDNNVTIVTGDAEKSLDVTSLIAEAEKVESEIPTSISNTVIANLTGETETKASEVKASDVKTETKASATTTVATTTSKPKETKPSTSTASTKSTSTVKSTPSSSATTTKASTVLYWVQTASLTSRIYAEDARNRLQEKNLKAEIFTKETVQGLVHRVRVGPFDNKTEASYWLSTIKKIDGFEGSFVSEERL